jgi:flagellar hook assembly protein FlgD
VKGPVNFRKHETAFLNLEKYVITSAGDIVIHEKPKLKCYPNPFMEEISIEVFLPESSVLTVEIIAQDGRLIRQLASNKQVQQGIQLFKWDGQNGQNGTVASGLYYLKISTEKHELRHKIIFNK